jgi:LysR family glycine cleavage system transcriptional activator
MANTFILFVRQGNRMALTDVGRALAIETRRALDYLSQAYSVAHVETPACPQTLNLAAQTGLIEHWLLPRLADLQHTLLRLSSRRRALKQVG